MGNARVKRCQQCGHENQDDDVFCGNCGTRLSTEPRTFTERPESVTTTETHATGNPGQPDSSDDWRMTSLGPPPARKRRLWLWILVSLLLLCVALCVAGGVSLTTDAGQEWFDGVATEASERATEAAG